MDDSQRGSLTVHVRDLDSDGELPIQVRDLKLRVAASGFSGTPILLSPGRYFVTATTAAGERLQVDEMVQVEPLSEKSVDLRLPLVLGSAGGDTADVPVPQSSRPPSFGGLLSATNGTNLAFADSVPFAGGIDVAFPSAQEVKPAVDFTNCGADVWTLEGDWLGHWLSPEAGRFPGLDSMLMLSRPVPPGLDVVVADRNSDPPGDRLLHVSLGQRTVTIALPLDAHGPTQIKVGIKAGEVTVVDVEFPSRSLNRFYKFIASSHTLEARSISRKIFDQARELILEKGESPLSAVLAAYVLLRANDRDPSQRASMDDWSAQLRRVAPWMPDATAIRIEWLARTGRDSEALELLLTLEKVGCPWFRSGLNYLVDRLKMYLSLGGSRIRSAASPSATDVQRLSRLLEALSRIALRLDRTQTLCVYRDVYASLAATTAIPTLQGDIAMEASVVRKFRGLVRVRDGRVTLTSGGVEVELQLSQGEPAVAFGGAMNNSIADIVGVQRGAVIEVNENLMSDAAVGSPDKANIEDVLTTLEAQYARLRQLPGVLAVRPGYRRVAGMQSIEPSIVVVVDRKRNEAELASGEMIPSRLGAVRVDVVEPSAQERREWRFVDFDDWKRALGRLPAIEEDAAAIGYRPPSNFILKPVTVRQVICHVGPDAGWKVLDGYLGDTRQKLSVSMYDLTASHVVERLSALGANASVRLDMILQIDKPVERESMMALHQRWGARLGFVPAIVSGSGRLFKNSYHTKVAVRDGNALWLSSGNWTATSQPRVSPGPQPGLYRLGNREWHVVIEDEALARLFEGFVQWDMSEAKRVSSTGGPQDDWAPDVLVAEADFLFADAMVVQPKPFEAAALPAAGGSVRIQPLMTPDNYPEAILNLIEGATSSLYLQYSYIRIPAGDDAYRRLLQAVNRKMHEGLDVRVIVDRRNQRDTDLHFLRTLGWDMERVRLQRSPVHNKGIIVDGKIVVVGSHNWSSDGTQWNRDASLILHHRDIAEYFTEVFLFDWQQLTVPVSTGTAVAAIAMAGEPTPPGSVRLPWHSWFEG